MRQRFTAAPGTSFQAIGLQTGLTLGIAIDNASGSWLNIPTLETWIPPYTLGWSQTFPYAVASVDIIAGDGPSGQIGTTQGDTVVVYLTDTPVASSAGQIATGAAFLTGFTPTLIENDVMIVPVSTGGLVQPLLPSVSGKRYRIHTITVALSPFGGSPPINFDSSVFFTYARTLIGEVLAGGRVGPDQPSLQYAFPNGLDFPVGEGIDFTALTAFATNYISRTTTYSLI